MATLTFNGSTDRINIPSSDAGEISASINAITDGAATIAVLMRRQSDTGNADDVFGLRGSNMGGNWYHGLRCEPDSLNSYTDDEGTPVTWSASAATHVVGAGGGNFCIVVLDWAAGVSTERIHCSAAMSAAESWTHANSGNNHGDPGNPGVGSGYFHIGDFDGAPFLGDIALIGIWSGTRFSDSDAEALWVNKKTSDWYNHSAGTPDTLIELTSTSLTDIGADPCATIAVVGATATGADPTGWDFDGQGGGTPQTICPDADTTTTGWTSTPLWSKIGSPADATIVTATAA